MTTRNSHSQRINQTAQASTAATVTRSHGILERSRERRAARNRRIIARSLRRVVKLANDRDPIRCRHDALLHDRAAAVVPDLLAIAALIECAPDPDPDCLAEIHRLLAHGCDSPLYNGNIHASELRATVHHIRSELASQSPAGPSKN
jgi:hypothetical protein